MTCPDCGLRIPENEPSCPICGFAVTPATTSPTVSRGVLRKGTLVIRCGRPRPIPAGTARKKTLVIRCGLPRTRRGKRATATVVSRIVTGKLRRGIADGLHAVGRKLAAVPRALDRGLIDLLRFEWNFLPTCWSRFERVAKRAFADIGRRIGGWIGTGIWLGIRLTILLLVLAVKCAVFLAVAAFFVVIGILVIILSAA